MAAFRLIIVAKAGNFNRDIEPAHRRSDGKAAGVVGPVPC